MRIQILVAALLLTLVPSTAMSQTASRVAPEVSEALGNQEFVEVLVVFDAPDVERKERRMRRELPARVAAIARIRSAVARGLGPEHMEMRRTFRHAPGFSARIDAEGLALLLADPNVRYIGRTAGGGGKLNEARAAANIDGLLAAGLSGSGITVAVLDTGIDTDHPELMSSIVAEACFCTTASGGGCCPGGATSDTGPGSAEDDNGHGSHVSGIITSDGTPSPQGSAPSAAIVAVKVLDSQNLYEDDSNIILALEWIIDNRPDVDIVNMSLGTDTVYPSGDCDNADAYTMLVASLIDTLRANEVIVTAAAGNDGRAYGMNAPACIRSVVSVAATYDADVGSDTFNDGTFTCTEPTTSANAVTCFTNWDVTTDIFAPGAPVESTDDAGSTYVDRGTSMSAPLVAGCAALIMENFPGLYGLIETAKANGIEPWAYLRHVFDALPRATSVDQIEALLPQNVDPALIRHPASTT